jgi:hypothetical protein
VNPLGKLPNTDPSVLAQRNLQRGFQMGLPSGQVLAEAMGQDVIPDETLKIGKATEEDSKTNKPLAEVFPRFKRNAPLWFYILPKLNSSSKMTIRLSGLDLSVADLLAKRSFGCFSRTANLSCARLQTGRPLKSF